MGILWYYSDIAIVGVNYCLPILYMSKTFVYVNSIEKLLNQFLIGYMVKPTLNVNKVFRDQVENSWKKILFKYRLWYKLFNE